MSSSRRSVLTAALAGLGAGGAAYGVQAAIAEPDPVFALIEAERRAYVRFDAACKGCDSVELGREETVEESATWDVANKAQEAALSAVMKAASTPAGIVAAIDLFIEREMENVSFRTDAFLLDLFASIRSHLGAAPRQGGQ